MQGYRSRPFWLELEPFFWSGSSSYSTVNILFLRDPKYNYESMTTMTMTNSVLRIRIYYYASVHADPDP